jgi:hypothetical protein
VGKDWVPYYVTVSKILGPNEITEKFVLSKQGATMNYEFVGAGKVDTCDVSITPRFQVATPNSAHKFLFIFSKKYDPTGRNFYSILTSDNNWNFTAPPVMKSVSLERVSISPVTIKIKDKELRANQFRVTAFKEDQTKDSELPINIYLSKHLNIPYLIDTPADIRIQIRYLQEFEIEDEDSDDPVV